MMFQRRNHARTLAWSEAIERGSRAASCAGDHLSSRWPSAYLRFHVRMRSIWFYFSVRGWLVDSSFSSCGMITWFIYMLLYAASDLAGCRRACARSGICCSPIVMRAPFGASSPLCSARSVRVALLLLRAVDVCQQPCWKLNHNPYLTSITSTHSVFLFAKTIFVHHRFIQTASGRIEFSWWIFNNTSLSHYQIVSLHLHKSDCLSLIAWNSYMMHCIIPADHAW
jgi:hypothetical protein